MVVMSSKNTRFNFMNSFFSVFFFHHYIESLNYFAVLNERSQLNLIIIDIVEQC